MLISELRIAEITKSFVRELGGLGPLKELLDDPSIDSILVTSPEAIFVTRNGCNESVGRRFLGLENLLEAIRRVFTMAQVPYDASQPFISAKIPDIGDISVINPPVAAKAPVLLIRKQKPIIHNLEHLIKVGVINETIAHLFRTGIAAYNNFLICGKSASIKSLLANAMMMEIPSEERVLMLDCQSELKQIHPHSVHLTGALEDFMRSDGTLRRNDFQQACSAIEANWILAGSMPLELLFFLVKKVSTERNGLIVTTQTMSAQEFLWSIEQGNVAHEINRSLEQIADTIDFIIEVGEQPCKEQRLLSILEVIDATGNQLVTQELFGYYPGTPSMQNDSVWRQVPKIKSSAKLRRRIRLENLRLSA